MIILCSRLLKKCLNQKLKLVLSSRSPYDFQKLLFICDCFGCKLLLQLIQNHARDYFQAFLGHNQKLWCSAWQCAVLLESEQSPCSMTGCQSRSAVLLCTGFNSQHVDLSLWHIFTQRPINDGKIEQRDEHCLGW